MKKIDLEIEKYSKTHLEREVRAIENSNRNEEYPILNVYEKALIYKYSNDGYEWLNEELRIREGKVLKEFGKYLDYALSKLPDYEGLVYRSAILTSRELKKYSDALKTGKPIVEYAFVSTSKSKLISLAWNGNTLFIINSKTGKEIGGVAKFGPLNPPDEKEVLMRPNLPFEVLEVTKKENYTLIVMEEM